MSLVPSEGHDEIVAQRTDLAPLDRRDPPSLWEKFVDFLRVNVGLKPLWLAERWAEANVRSLEVDNEVKLLRARIEYEKAMAEVRQRDQKTSDDSARAKAETDSIKLHNRNDAVNARLNEMIEKFIRQSQLSPDEAWEEVERIRQKIELQHGGHIEIVPPERLDGQPEDEG